MESKEKRLLEAIFNTEDEPDDNYPGTVIEKVGYAEYVVIHALGNIAPAIQRLSRLHRLLTLEEKNSENKLPDIITHNEVQMALKPLLQVKNDIKDITEMLIEVYRATKPPEAKAALKGEK